jgi:hypothetical protein
MSTARRHRFRHPQVDAVELIQRDMLRLATLDAARVWHLDHEIGSLTPGKHADVTVIDVASLRYRTRAAASVAAWVRLCRQVATGAESSRASLFPIRLVDPHNGSCTKLHRLVTHPTPGWTHDRGKSRWHCVITLSPSLGLRSAR